MTWYLNEDENRVRYGAEQIKLETLCSQQLLPVQLFYHNANSESTHKLTKNLSTWVRSSKKFSTNCKKYSPPLPVSPSKHH